MTEEAMTILLVLSWVFFLACLNSYERALRRCQSERDRERRLYDDGVKAGIEECKAQHAAYITGEGW